MTILQYSHHHHPPSKRRRNNAWVRPSGGASAETETSPDRTVPVTFQTAPAVAHAPILKGGPRKQPPQQKLSWRRTEATGTAAPATTQQPSNEQAQALVHETTETTTATVTADAPCVVELSAAASAHSNNLDPQQHPNDPTESLLVPQPKHDESVATASNPTRMKHVGPNKLRRTASKNSYVSKSTALEQPFVSAHATEPNHLPEGSAASSSQGTHRAPSSTTASTLVLPTAGETHDELPLQLPAAAALLQRRGRNKLQRVDPSQQASNVPSQRLFKKRPRLSAKQAPAKRIRLPASTMDSNKDEPQQQQQGKTLTDFAYSRSRKHNGSLIRLAVDESETPICPTFLKGKVCGNVRCTKRHDIPKSQTMPLCLYFQRHGQCFHEHCPFRHVKVNLHANPCPQFERLGFCENPQCTLLHPSKRRPPKPTANK